MSYLDVVDLEESYGAGLGTVSDPLDIFSGDMAHTVDGYAYGTLHRSSISDFSDGDFRPFWFNEVMHSEHRAQSRLLATAITMANAIMDNLENYTIGGGFQYKARSRTSVVSGEHVVNMDSALVSMVQKDIEDFCELNNWNAGGLENEIHNRTRRDGEDFIALYKTRHGIEARLINAEHFKAPHGQTRDLEDRLKTAHFPSSWKYGVHTPEHDLQQALGYFAVWNESQTSWSYFPAENWHTAREFGSGVMHHIKRNVDRKVKRGMSDFYPVARQIVDDAKLNRNTVSGAAAQASIAWIEEFKQGFTRSDIMKSEQSGSDGKIVKRDSMGGMRNEYRRSYGGATKLVMSYGKDFKPGPMSGNREGGFGLVGALAARRIGIRWAMPEYMISGDASNNNLASAVVSEGPFTKAREKDQRFYAMHFREIMWKMLDCHVTSGRYSRYGVRSLEALKSRIAIEVVAPEVADRDRKAEAESNEIYLEQGVISKDTVRQKIGVDARAEQGTVAKEHEVDFQQGLTESDVRRIAHVTQKMLWEDWDSSLKEYP